MDVILCFTGLPPGISALPGPSLSSSSGGSQDSAAQGTYIKFISVPSILFTPAFTLPAMMPLICLSENFIQLKYETI